MSNGSYRRMSVVTLGLLIVLLTLPNLVVESETAASITVLSPGGGPSDILPEGEDYFTLVLGDPRDMNQRLDLRFQHPDITNITVDDGLWRGDGGNRTFPLFCGFGSSAADLGQTGQDFPIDTSRFNYFSVRAQSSQDTFVRLYYWAGPFTGSGYAGGENLAPDEMHTLHWDASASLPAQVAGLMLEIEGDPFAVDWVRLTDPSSSPVYTVTWTADDVNYVDIYGDTDTDPAVLDYQIASWVEAGSGSYTWETGFLAPGTYYIYVVDSQSPGVAAYSPGPLTIQPAPVVEITAPSRTSGDDYATTELGDPWDMADGTDISFKNQVESVSYSSGQMNAITTGVDPYVHLKSAGVNTVGTNYYKYLTWRFYVEGDWADARRRLGGGTDRWGVSRVYLDPGEDDYNTSNDVIPWEGWHIYQMDLSRGGGTYYLDDASPGPGAGWNGLRSTVRLDFLEPLSDDRWPIHLDYVLLTADPRPSDGEYEIRWQVLQGEPVTTTLYYTTEPASSSCDDGGTFIVQIAPSPPAPPPGPFRVYLPLVMVGSEPAGGGYIWDDLPPDPDEYYVQILADDGLNRTCWTSDAPLVIDP